MHFYALFAAAVVPLMVHAAPAPNFDIEGNDGYIETIVYKRDSALSPRDLELATSHGVNVTQSKCQLLRLCPAESHSRIVFRHSLIRRADGDDVTIWVHNSYQEHKEEAAPAVEARAYVWGDGGHGFDPKIFYDQCAGSDYSGLTSKVSAFTGGVWEMYRWANTRRAGFEVPAYCCPGDGWTTFENLVIAGSNAGANARFGVKHYFADDRRYPLLVGTEDIRDVTRETLARFQANYDGKWRVASSGRMACTNPIGWSPSTWTQWTIGRVDERVPGT